VDITPASVQPAVSANPIAFQIPGSGVYFERSIDSVHLHAAIRCTDGGSGKARRSNGEVCRDRTTGYVEDDQIPTGSGSNGIAAQNAASIFFAPDLNA
jgi:hypothetical protein